MFNGICVYAENFDGQLDPVVAELATAAAQIKEKTGEPVQAILISEKRGSLIEQLEQLSFDEIYIVETHTSCLFKDDAISHVISQALNHIKPSTVLIPASVTARSLFSRVAILTDTGLTADCTSLEAVRDQEGRAWHIRQDKPSFGDNVMVSIITKEDHYPQMMTIRQGVYAACTGNSAKPKINYLNDIAIPESKIEMLGMTPHSGDADSLSAAQIVCVGGRGALEGDNLKLLREFAAKIGAAVGGTRPLAEEGIIPFENQIGQTGKTIRPRICLSFGVSGAIQHTEGIKEAKLFIAVNTDANSAIFNVADYGAVAGMEEILTKALEKLG